MYKVYTVCFLLAISNTCKAGPFDNLSLKVTSAVGGLSSKKEDPQFTKFRNDPLYSTFFSLPITNSNEFKGIFESYKGFLKNWNNISLSTFNVQVPDLNATLAQPVLFARMYDFMEYIVRQDVPLDGGMKDKIKTEIVLKCRPKAPIMADNDVKNGSIKYKDYLFLSPDCSKKIIDVLKTQEKYINSFLGYAYVKPAQESIQKIEEPAIKERTPIGQLREKCKISITPDCVALINTLYFSQQSRPIVAQFYGKGFQTAPVALSDNLNRKLATCRVKESFNKDQCAPIITEILNAWDEVDQQNDSDLHPNPLSYLAEHSDVLELELKPEDFRRQVLFENYEGYKDIDSVFSEVYSMACALDPSYRLRVSPLARANFIEQELVMANSGIGKSARESLTKIQNKMEKIAESDKALLSSVAKSANGNIVLASAENKFLPPVTIYKYIENYDNLALIPLNTNTPQPEEVVPTTESKSIADALSSENPFNTLGYENLNISVDLGAVYSILSKICMSILGPEYLKAEADITKALETQDKQAFEQTLKATSDQINNPQANTPSQKDSRAFRYLPSNEYNKLRQISLIILTNIHVLLLDELDKQNDKTGSFNIVAKQIIEVLPKQIAFLSRYLFALKEKKYDASDLSTSAFSDTFAELFLMPVYPLVIDKNKIPDQGTLVDASGTNMYSLYSTYLLGSIQGVVDFKSQTNLTMDNRGQKNRVLGNFAQQFGIEATVNIEWVVNGAIKATLDMLPIPKPPIITSAVVSGLTAVMMVGPQWAYKSLKNTCRFNKDKCVAKNVKNVTLTRPLVVRVTEFLMAMEISLKTYLESSQQGTSKQKDPNAYKKLIPTLYVLEQDDKVVQDRNPVPPSTTVNELIENLIRNTRSYYDSLGEIKKSSAENNESPNVQDLKGFS